ncbi:MAG: TVP38/TMEM64 family protein [SAR324 cluster bacterium]|nr:TVP38/TMEM64 family protein [SAR324 cluster bacterium]
MEFLKQNLLKTSIALAILLGILLFFLFDLQQYLTLEYLRHSKEGLIAYNTDHPLLTMGSYLLLYFFIAALSLPGAAILTIAGGTIFGLVKGTILVSVASTLGATTAMLVARTLLKNYVQQKFKEQIPAINKKIEEEGAFYLFTLRLVPAFPFFVINLAMGITPIKTFTFAWVSQLGMLAGTIVYVNAGSELGKIKTLGDIASPGLLISFALLGVFPLMIKKLLDFFLKKRNSRPSS